MHMDYRQNNMDMNRMENAVVEEATKEEVKEVELVKDMDRSFSITAANREYLQEISRTPLRHVSIVSHLTMSLKNVM